ncbi:YegJ family protein [Chitinophaga rhizophila]|uniref:DUF2314 domain-containing protein n=1 Tax=Chitinophaga rhizophila TaxID=2866212 RepID=A0ABS7GBQ6_9BACT|nr:DUF2314 domain-containing protein [Chitinophaga rhizophila]MBW8683968.1 DUF2314 domain-containing protein [Chitinophaga rhizophila]
MGFLSKFFGKRSKADLEEQLPVVHIADDDERMNWAIEKAIATLHYFQDNLLQPDPVQQYFSVKVLIDDGVNREHLWLTSPSFDDEGNLYGIVGNKPVYVNSVAVNQKIGIDPRFISDWMIIEDGRLIGGYTIRAIRDGKPVQEWAEFDRQIGLYIDEGIDYFAHDFSTPEGAILCLEDAYDEQDIDKAVDCKNFVEEARLLLMKMNDIFSGNDILHTTADILRTSFIKSLETDGFPVFRDLRRAFPYRKKITDQLYLITEVCIFPDGGKRTHQIYTFKGEDGWRVLNLVQ